MDRDECRPQSSQCPGRDVKTDLMDATQGAWSKEQAAVCFLEERRDLPAEPTVSGTWGKGTEEEFQVE